MSISTYCEPALFAFSLTGPELAATMTALFPSLETVGIETPYSIGPRPLLTVAFLYPPKARALLRLAYSVMVECVRQPLKRLAGSYAGSLNLIHSATQRLRPKGGGYSTYIGVSA